MGIKTLDNMAKGIIKPNRVYTTAEAADLLGTSERTLIDELIEKRKLRAVMLGKGWKILGETILNFLR